MKHFMVSVLILSLLSLAGCQYFTPAPQMTSLQIQSMQSRTFSVDKKIAFSSVMTVFQNLGYIIGSAEYNTGFITAESPSGNGWFNSNNKTKVTAFIESIDKNSSRIRLNFVEHSEFATQNGVI